MLRREFVKMAVGTAAAFVLLLGAGAAQAGEETVPATEIFELLNGNTISGDWNGAPYKSFFATDGVTIYAPAGGAASRGRWRVNYESNTYESWWEHSGWGAYGVVRTDRGLAWVQGAERHHFTILKGRQITE